VAVKVVLPGLSHGRVNPFALALPVVMPVHEGDIAYSLLVADEGANLRPARVDVAALDEKLLRDLLVRHDDEGVFDGAGLVDRSVNIRPLLELHP
jgi:hypothetical protein